MRPLATAILATVAIACAAYSQDPLADLRRATAQAAAGNPAPLGDIIVNPPPFGYPVYDQAVEGRIIQAMRLLEGWRDRHIENDEKIITELGRLNQTATETKDIGQKTLDVIGDPAAYRVNTPPGSQIMNYETDFDELGKTAKANMKTLPADSAIDKGTYQDILVSGISVEQAKSVVATSSALRRANESKIAEILTRVSTAQTFADLQKAQAELLAMTTAQQILAADEQGAMNVIILAQSAAERQQEKEYIEKQIQLEKEDKAVLKGYQERAAKTRKKIFEDIKKGPASIFEGVNTDDLSYGKAGEFNKEAVNESMKKAKSQFIDEEDEYYLISESWSEERKEKAIKMCEEKGIKYKMVP
jgi:hypothetical protein